MPLFGFLSICFVLCNNYLIISLFFSKSIAIFSSNKEASDREVIVRLAKVLINKIFTYKLDNLRMNVLLNTTLQQDAIHRAVNIIFNSIPRPRPSNNIPDLLTKKLENSFKIKRLLEGVVKDRLQKKHVNKAIEYICGGKYIPKTELPKKTIGISPLALYQNDHLEFAKEQKDVNAEIPAKKKRLVDKDNDPEFEDIEIDVVN